MIQRTSPAPLRLEATGEDLEIVSPDGKVSVRIAFTADGPVVSIEAARIRLDTEDLSLRLNKLEIDAESEVRIRSRGEVHVDGAMLRLNCAEPQD